MFDHPGNPFGTTSGHNQTRERQQENSLSVMTLPETEDAIIKDYLYRVRTGKIADKRITIDRIIALSVQGKVFVRPPYLNLDPLTGMHHFSDLALLFSVQDAGKQYELFFSVESGVLDAERQFRLSISGFSDDADAPDSLFQHIRQQAIVHSLYQGKVLHYRHETDSMLDNLKVIKAEKRDINEIYLPDAQLLQIRRFIHSIKQGSRDSSSLRFLLNGRPGTGKTEITRAIISEVAGERTVLIAQGAECPVNQIFDFISLFPNSLLIIDDIDFIAEERQSARSRRALGNLLGILDGYLPNRVHLIATTNDHRLVDEAASRPGRFDIILDIPEIGTERYEQLIRRETSDEEIISLFTEPLKNRMKNNRVTGAFIVNLVKQLKGLKELQGTINDEELENLLELTLRAIKRTNLSAEVGFN